jgi:hypothetical protein
MALILRRSISEGIRFRTEDSEIHLKVNQVRPTSVDLIISRNDEQRYTLEVDKTLRLRFAPKLEANVTIFRIVREQVSFRIEAPEIISVVRDELPLADFARARRAV